MKRTNSSPSKKCWVHQFSTPLGLAIAAAKTEGSSDSLIRLSFIGSSVNADSVLQELISLGYSTEENPEALADVEQQLAEYFRGERKVFDLALAPEGTPFQQRVWAELLKIPYGETISYIELARRVGNPKASRAVGGANGSNPIWLIVPCHRVIGSNGTLTGYAGGVGIKQTLLELEGVKIKSEKPNAEGRKTKTDFLQFDSSGTSLLRS
jgi:methylated-DNA-[protein]-cysteine S-methyltransferase